MAVFKCKMCGGTIEFEPGATVGVCDSCGTKQTLPTANDEVVANLHNRATTLRLKCEFDKAEEIYNKILVNNPNDAEAHWGIILCKYGIEYVEDPKTYKRIPTCHRTSFEAILADEDYKAAMENGNAAQRELYEAEAKEIDRIQKDILAIVKNEKPFDVFICYKETDENGKRTQDSVMANDIYYQLTQEGFKVFYAAITLEDKLGQEYEPYIFAALNSAKVMLVVGSKQEYFNAVWVKNEWSRFLKLMKADRSKLLIPCYRDIDAYELPEEFAHLQAQDMSKIGFINDLVRGIKKVVSDSAAENTVKETVVVNSGNANIAPLLKRAYMFLEDGDWQRADDFCEQVLNLDPENGQAYLGKLMAELKIKKQNEIVNNLAPIESSDNYKKAVRFGDEKLRKILTETNDKIKERNILAEKQRIYDEAVKDMKRASITSLSSAADAFSKIKGFKNADKLATECKNQAEKLQAEADELAAAERKRKEELRKKDDYRNALEALEKNTVHLEQSDNKILGFINKIKYYFTLLLNGKNIKSALNSSENTFSKIPDYLDSAEKAEICRIESKRIDEDTPKAIKLAAITAGVIIAIIVFLIVLTTVIIPNNKYNSAVALMNNKEYDEAITAFEALNRYKDSTDKISLCQTALKDIDYNTAVSLMDACKYDEAITAFEALNRYKDSKDKASECLFLVQKTNLSDIKIGDTIKFGAYEQDNNTTNGKEEIEWIVLNVKGSKALFISKYALDRQRYNTSYTDVTWEKCTLRKWLNDSFLNTAFGSKHQELISSVSVSADKNPAYSTNPGNATTDKVFLLSITEAEKYFTTYESRNCAPTAYAKAQGAYTSDSYKTASGEATCWWWLRAPGYLQQYAADVFIGGSVHFCGFTVDNDLVCVRPALWINLDS